MYQAIEPFQVVLFFMGSVVLVRNSAVAIGSVVFGVDQANIMQQSLVLKLAAALGSVCPFIVTGTIQVQNVTSLGYCIPLFLHFLNTNVEIFLSYSDQRHLLSSYSSFFSTAFSVSNLLFRASSNRFSARSFSTSVISDSGLRLPRLSTRPSAPFSLYFLTHE